jgi:Fe2+ transport system protein FeoA
MTAQLHTQQDRPRTLADLTPGQSGVVETLDLSGPARRRLLDLGFIPGTRVVAEFTSPLGDPTSYRVRGALIALRRDQAREIGIRLLQLAEAAGDGE